MKMRVGIICSGVAFLVISSLSWLWVVQRHRTHALLALVNTRESRYVDFLVYRAYRDAELDIVRGVVTFPTTNIWAETFQAGTLKVSADFQRAKIQTAIAEFGSLYNWHKSRAAYRRLHESVPAVANQFLDGLERIEILTHSARLGVESTNVIDPY